MINLADFEGIVGPPEVTPSDAEWAAREASLGLKYPSDFKQWANHYSSVFIDDFMYISHPAMYPPSNEAEVATGTLDGIRELTETWGRSSVYGKNGELVGEDLPKYPCYPEKGGLLVWGGTVNGDLCMWRTEGLSKQWPVVVSDGTDWFEFDGGFLKFLVQVLRRDFVCPLFPDVYLTQPAIREALRWEQTEPTPYGGGGMRTIWHTPERWREYFEQRGSGS